jgi:hypothetical protein
MEVHPYGVDESLNSRLRDEGPNSKEDAEADCKVRPRLVACRRRTGFRKEPGTNSIGVNDASVPGLFCRTYDGDGGQVVERPPSRQSHRR